MEWVIVAIGYLGAFVVALYKFGSPGALAIVVFASVQALGIYQDWHSNPLVTVFLAGFAAFMVTIMIPHWYLVATGREGIIGRKRPSDEDF